MKLSFRKAILIYTLLPIIILFSIFAVNNMMMIKREALQSIENHMSDLAISYAGIFDGFLKPIEGAAIINASLIEESDALTDKNIYKLLELQVENNPIIYGAAIAFIPHQFSPEVRLYAPYVYRKEGQLSHINIAEQGYDYTDGDWEWWTRVVETGQAAWSEPYFDKGAGNILMSTYAVPFYKDNKLWGVATADIALDRIDNQIHIPGVRGQEFVVLSSTGKVILHWDEDQVGQSIYDLIEEKFNATLLIAGSEHKQALSEVRIKLEQLIKNMLAGEVGVVNLQFLGDSSGYMSFFAPIQSVGWSFSIRVKESDIFKIVYEQFWLSVLFFCLLMVLVIIAIVLVSGKFSRSLDGLMRRCERIERLNFQPTEDKSENIDEILQLSHTLNNMCLVLDSHYSNAEDMRITEAIRQHSLTNDDVSLQLKGFQIESWSNAGGDNCGEIFDFIVFDPGDGAQGGSEGRDKSLAILLLDDADSGIDAAIKNGQLRAIFRVLIKQGNSLAQIAVQMNDYLLSDMNLNGSVQLSLGHLDGANTRFSYVNLGHNSVFHYSEQKLTQYTGSQQALAMQQDLSGIRTKSMVLATGDFIILCSDGVTGALNEQREQFGKQSIERVVKQLSEPSAEALIQSLQSELEVYTDKAYLQTEQSIIVIQRC